MALADYLGMNEYMQARDQNDMIDIQELISLQEIFKEKDAKICMHTGHIYKGE